MLILWDCSSVQLTAEYSAEGPLCRTLLWSSFFFFFFFFLNDGRAGRHLPFRLFIFSPRRILVQAEETRYVLGAGAADFHHVLDLGCFWFFNCMERCSYLLLPSPPLNLCLSGFLPSHPNCNFCALHTAIKGCILLHCPAWKRLSFSRFLVTSNS